MSTPESGPTELIVTGSENVWDVRQSTATEITDPFVRVYIMDLPHSGPSYTRIRTTGVAEYDDYERLGEDSQSTVGRSAKIEIESRLLTSEERPIIAQHIAALAFMLSGSD